MGTGFSKKKKQAKAFQEKLSQMQNDMDTAEATGTAANGLVTITLSGSHEMKNIKIKPECVDAEDIEGLEDLIKTAYQDALKKLPEPGLPPGMESLAGLF